MAVLFLLMKNHKNGLRMRKQATVRYAIRYLEYSEESIIAEAVEVWFVELVLQTKGM